MLPFQTPTQFLALGLTLIAGWLLGFGSSSGGRKWRERYQDEELAHTQYREQAEADVKLANARIRELEDECNRLRAIGPVPSVEATPAAAADPNAGWRGWFGWGRDNLTRIRGIDEAREKQLNAAGIKAYREIEKMSPEEEAALEQRLEIAKGTIAGEHWREQAALLREGNDEDHAARFA